MYILILYNYNLGSINTNTVEKWVANYWLGYEQEMLNKFLNDL
jgi:hypothetical protein